MDYVMIGLLGVVMVAMVVILLRSASGDKKSASKSGSKNSKSTGKKEATTTDNKDHFKKEDVFKFMEFDTVQDNMIIQNGGKKYTMAIRCKGINYDLMSEAEQMAVEQGFITFLNTLKYPVQFYVQAQNIDLKDVVRGYKERVEPLLEEYAVYNRMYEEKSGIFDVDKEELEQIDSVRTRINNVYEYANDIISYVEKMSVNKNLLQRNFYTIVSYYKADIPAVDKFSKEEVEEMCRTELMTRCNSIISALASSSVMGTILDSNELSELLYVAYNRDDKSMLSVREAVNSGYYRLFSTSKDAFQRENEAMQDAIDTQAKLKAISSLKRALDDGTHKTKSQKELDEIEAVSREATDMIKAENIDPDIKQDALDYIMEDYREDKKEYTKKIQEEQEEEKTRANEQLEELTQKYEQTDLYKLNQKREEKINEYNDELKREKEDIIKTLNDNGEKLEDDLLNSGENDPI